MPELFIYPFFIRAILASILVSVTCGIIGTYIVSKRIVFIGGGISHASFGGIGIGYYLGFDPIIGAAAFAVASAFGIEILSKKSNMRVDSLIGILWSFGMAIGIIFVFLTPGYAPNLMSYLFGSILTISYPDIYMMSVLCIISILLFYLFFKEILFIAFDEEYATTQGIPVTTINYILLALIALTIVINIRAIGVILVISLLTIPQATSGLFTSNFKKIILFSIFFGLFACLSGLIASYYLEIPSGASIIFSSVAVFAILKIADVIFLRIKLARYYNEAA